MANATHDYFADFDFARARWLIEIFDEACRAFPHQPPSEAERALLAQGIIRASRQCGWDRFKLRQAVLASLHTLTDGKAH